MRLELSFSQHCLLAGCTLLYIAVLPVMDSCTAMVIPVAPVCLMASQPLRLMFWWFRLLLTLIPAASFCSAAYLSNPVSLHSSVGPPDPLSRLASCCCHSSHSWILARIVAFPPFFYVIYVQREQIALLSTYTKFLCEFNCMRGRGMLCRGRA